MPRAPKTQKPASNAMDTLEGAGNLDPAALNELDQYLNEAGNGTSKKGKKDKKETKPAAEDMGLGGLDDIDGLGGLDDPSTDEVQGPTFGQGDMAGVSARIDSLVEHLSDNHNSLSNRIDSLQETVRSIFEYLQVRMDEILDSIKNLETVEVQAQQEEVEIDIHNPEDVAGYIGHDVNRVKLILTKCRGLANPVDGPKFVAWLQSVGLSDESVVRFCGLYEIDAGTKVTAKFFQP